jgi:hypothetical protein
VPKGPLGLVQGLRVILIMTKFALVADKPLTGYFNYGPTFTEVFSRKLKTTQVEDIF